MAPEYHGPAGDVSTQEGLHPVDLASDVKNDLPVAEGGTGSSTAGGARTNLGVDPAGTDNSTDVTLDGAPNYITIAGQLISRALVSLTSHITGVLPLGNGGTGASDGATARSNLGVTEPPTLIHKTADETVNNSATLQDDDTFTFSVSANKNYAVWGVLITDSGTTPEVKTQWSLPASATADCVLTKPGGNVPNDFDEDVTAFIPGFGAGTPRAATFIGTMTVRGTAGTAVIQWAQNVADASDTKVLQGSWLAHQLLN